MTPSETGIHITTFMELTVSYPISNGYDHEYNVAKLYFIETISRHTHNEIKDCF